MNKKNCSAAEVLFTCCKLIEERGAQHDPNGRGEIIKKTVTAFNAITDHRLSEEDGWFFLQLLKNSRLYSGYTEDSAIDGVAYAALMAACKIKNSS